MFLDSCGEYFDRLNYVLKHITATYRDESMPVDAAVDVLVATMSEARKNNSTVYFAGNGASAMMAGHSMIDFTKNVGIKSCAFNDPAMLTAVGNDIGFDQIFSFPFSCYANSGDLVVTISSSGNSPDVVRLLTYAKEHGYFTVGLSGMSPDNASCKLADLSLHFPDDTYGIVETAHQAFLHYWLDIMSK